MIELRHLSHLLVTCEHENLTQAAEDLQIAPSTLSASLKGLETEIGCSLFKRLGSDLYPLQGARWMFRVALPMLLLERHTRRRLRATTASSMLNLNIGLKFTIGRASKAILRAIAETEAEDPLVLVHPVWTEDQPGLFDEGWPNGVGAGGADTLTLKMIGPGAEPADGETVLMRDLWVLAYRIAGDSAVPPDLAERTVLVPSVSRGIFEALEQRLLECGIRRTALLQEHPGSLPRLMNEHPEAAFLMPGSALSRRLGLRHVSATPIEPALTTTLVGRAELGHPIADRFMERLRRALAEPEQITAFTPELTSRRVRYFNLAYRLRSFSAAARLGNVAQPALSEQLRKLELALGARLFDRRSSGVSPTEESARFAPVAQALETGLCALKIGAMSSFNAEDLRLSLGVLPSVSQHGLLINCITEAVLALRAQHPNIRVTVQEAPNGTLQDWVARGHVGLAIVETGPPQLPRLPLAAAEELAVIAHPRHAILPPGPAAFAALGRLPLVLPTVQFGLRQLLESTARAQRVELRPVMEIDALAMLIAILKHDAVCTVLPASAVRLELDRGELCAHPIVEPAVARRLFVIYSGDRSLTAPEREFVSLLRGGLTESAPGAEAALIGLEAYGSAATAALH